MKREFSKGHVIFANTFMVFVWICWVVLQWFGKEPPSDLAMSLVTAYGSFATVGYFTLQGVRNCSINNKEARIHEADCGSVIHGDEHR